MASSIGSLPFLWETSAETFVKLDTKSCSSLRFPLKVCGIKGSAFEHSERLGLGWRKRGLLRGSKHISATGGKSFGTYEDEDGSKDALQATIEKSKKVYALQRDLLQQIAERKKLVSSINGDSIVESEGDIISYECSDRSLSNKSNPQNASNGRGNAVENQNGGVVGINQGFDEVEEDVRVPPPEMASSRQYFNGQLKDKQYEAISHDALPAFLTNGTETSSLEVENQEGEESTDESSNIESEGETPLPLAGTNVMNVILVAAECAPWSKTDLARVTTLTC